MPDAEPGPFARPNLGYIAFSLVVRRLARLSGARSMPRCGECCESLGSAYNLHFFSSIFFYILDRPKLASGKLAIPIL